MGIKDRVRKLEGEEPERCPECLERNGHPVYVGDFPEGGVPALPTDYQPCASCGWEPTIIHVVFTEEAGRL